MSDTNLTRVRYQDIEEVSQALRRLGSSESEELLYKGTIFVEGDEDVELLELGFGAILRQYKLKALGGRKEVEKQIKLLMDAEASGSKINPKYFIFDRDDNPTELKSAASVKLLQWDRTCVENYLIDFEALTDLMKDSDIVAAPLTNEGATISLFKNAAMRQIPEVAAREVYEQLQLNNLRLSYPDFSGKTPDKISEELGKQIAGLKKRVEIEDIGRWSNEYVRLCALKAGQLEPVWSENWPKLCDGKQLFSDVHKTVQFKISVRSLKRRIMSRMSRVPGTENWRAVEGLLRSLIQT